MVDYLCSSKSWVGSFSSTERRKVVAWAITVAQKPWWEVKNTWKYNMWALFKKLVKSRVNAPVRGRIGFSRVGRIMFIG